MISIAKMTPLRIKEATTVDVDALAVPLPLPLPLSDWAIACLGAEAMRRAAASSSESGCCVRASMVEVLSRSVLVSRIRQTWYRCDRERRKGGDGR